MNKENLIDDLRAERRRLGFSTLQFATYFRGVSYREIYRWLEGVKPLPPYGQILKSGLRRLRNIPTPPSSPLTTSRGLYRQLRDFLSIEEKIALLDLEGEE